MAFVLLVVGASSAGTASPASADRAGDDMEFADREVVVSEADGWAEVVVRRAATLALEESKAWYSTVERTAVDGDFSPTSGWLRMGVGQTIASITIPVHDDFEDEPGDQSFAVRLGSSPQGTIVIDEVIVNLRDDDAARSSGADTVDAANAPSSRVGGQTAAQRQATPQVVAPAGQVQRRVASSRSPTRATAAKTDPPPRVTPFELRTPSESNSSLPVPDHASPVVAAAFLAAIALARVCAELWFRWRTLTG